MTKPEMQKTKEPQPLSLVGRAFHTFEDRDGDRTIKYQGIVRGKITESVYLVQYFEWIMGEPSTLELVTLDGMMGWQFYEDTEHMGFWYEHRYVPPRSVA